MCSEIEILRISQIREFKPTPSCVVLKDKSQFHLGFLLNEAAEISSFEQNVGPKGPEI